MERVPNMDSEVREGFLRKVCFSKTINGKWELEGRAYYVPGIFHVFSFSLLRTFYGCYNHLIDEKTEALRYLMLHKGQLVLELEASSTNPKVHVLLLIHYSANKIPSPRSYRKEGAH